MQQVQEVHHQLLVQHQLVMLEQLLVYIFKHHSQDTLLKEIMNGIDYSELSKIKEDTEYILYLLLIILYIQHISLQT